MSPVATRLPRYLAAAAFALTSTVWMAGHYLTFYSWCRTAFGMAILKSCGLG